MHFILKNKYTKLIAIVLLIVCLIPTLLGVLHAGFFTSDDGNWMVIRFSAFYEALRNGQIPVRFLPRLNNGFGYPVADFLYPLFLYIGVPIHIIGFSFLNTIKIIFILSFLGGGISCYYWLEKRFNNILAAFVGAMIFSYFPYHLWDMYGRGSLGEVLTLAVVPFIFWQAERRSVVLAALGLSWLILAHNVLALLFLPILLIHFVRCKLFSLPTLAFLTCLGLGLAAFFWVPALYDKQFTIFDTTSVANVSQYFVWINNIGLVGIISAVVSLGALITFIRKPESTLGVTSIVGLLIFILTLPISLPIWHVIPSNFIQFPFRLLSIVCVGVGFLAAYIISSIKPKHQLLIAGVFLVCSVISAWFYLFPTNFQYYPDSFYSTNQDTTTVHGEYMPKWVLSPNTTYTPKKLQTLNGNASVESEVEKGATIMFTSNVMETTTFQINYVYFPGWTVIANKKNIPINFHNPHGLIQFTLGPGVYTVRVAFGETPIRFFSDGVSLIVLLILIGYLVKTKKI